MNASELKDMDAASLNVKLTELLKEQFNLRMQKTTGQLQKTHEIRNIRRDIARVKTILTQKAGE
jgi:large subunit ribosomal protein L29